HLIPVTGDTDLRQGPALRDRRLDHIYAPARSPAIVAWPDLELRLDFDPPIETVVVYTPPHAACVEPQTAWPNAPTLHESGIDGTGLTTVAPGGTLEATTTWTWGPPTRLGTPYSGGMFWLSRKKLPGS
ncbi:MAG: hypothetical protein ACRDJJ_04645, partial [Actinomycetota bacterium]